MKSTEPSKHKGRPLAEQWMILCLVERGIALLVPSGKRVHQNKQHAPQDVQSPQMCWYVERQGKSLQRSEETSEGQGNEDPGPL